MFENNKGEYLEVYGQRHTLFSETQAWDEENEDSSQIRDAITAAYLGFSGYIT